MESFNESSKVIKVSIPQILNIEILDFLLRSDGQEDLLFGLWYPSSGTNTITALVQSIILPEKGDRTVHGNVSFNYSYFKRACQIALQSGCGLVFMHSHPYPGWQNMSTDDIKAESRMAPTTETITNLPLLGMTVGSDGTWSGRIWFHDRAVYRRKWVKYIKVIGSEFKVFFDETQKFNFSKSEILKRTISVWGRENQELLTNLNIGIVGLGSVGSIVAETLARMGLRNITLIDFDIIERHNLDRTIGANKEDIGQLKVDVIAKSIIKSATIEDINIRKVHANLNQEIAYKEALDCDFIFCCADKPQARYILNHIAFSHLIPVVNGGILAEVDNNELNFADWESSIISPERPCLQCLKAYTSSDVILEIEGKLEDPEYIKGLLKNSLYKQNQNVMPFSMNLASLEVLQFIAYTTGIADLELYGVQRYRFVHAEMSNYRTINCHPNCDFSRNIAMGDKFICPIS